MIVSFAFLQVTIRRFIDFGYLLSFIITYAKDWHDEYGEE
jgi:hypothetical protein